MVTAGTCPGCGRPFPMTRAGQRYCGTRCRKRAGKVAAAEARRRRKALSAARRTLARIAEGDRRFLAERTSRGLGFDPGSARSRSPVPWEGDE